jgi:hypothetical protein
MGIRVERVDAEGFYAGGWGGGLGSDRGFCDIHGNRSTGRNPGESKVRWTLFHDASATENVLPFHDPAERWRTSSYHALHGFGYASGERQGDVWWKLFAPHWFVAAALALPPFGQVARARRKALRSRAGLCRSCGYDLRATPDRCPECGAVPATLNV